MYSEDQSLARIDFSLPYVDFWNEVKMLWKEIGQNMTFWRYLL